jgi:hypothetical protein
VNPRLSRMQLEEILDWQIRPALRTVPGIVEVDSFGGERRQYQVVLDPARLQAAGMSVAQVVDALEKSNANAGGGYIEHNRERFVIGTSGLVKDIDDLRRVVIGLPEGVPITVATVGDAAFGPRLRYGAASMNGKGEVVVESRSCSWEKLPTVTERVKASSFPSSLRCRPALGWRSSTTARCWSTERSAPFSRTSARVRFSSSRSCSFCCAICAPERWSPRRSPSRCSSRWRR